MNKLTDNIYIQCILGENKKVLSQNELCKSLCGDMKGISCSKGCQKHFPEVSNKESIFLTNRVIHNKSFNLSMFKTNDMEIINLYPTGKEKKSIDFSELTTKEKLVADLMSKGYKNLEISNQLNITKATVKTHINRIYHKLGENFLTFRQ